MRLFRGFLDNESFTRNRNIVVFSYGFYDDDVGEAEALAQQVAELKKASGARNAHSAVLKMLPTANEASIATGHTGQMPADG
ncbi:MAG: hypothetical protein WCL44_13010 [bacterium]